MTLGQNPWWFEDRVNKQILIFIYLIYIHSLDIILGPRSLFLKASLLTHPSLSLFTCMIFPQCIPWDQNWILHSYQLLFFTTAQVWGFVFKFSADSWVFGLIVNNPLMIGSPCYQWYLCSLGRWRSAERRALKIIITSEPSLLCAN